MFTTPVVRKTGQAWCAGRTYPAIALHAVMTRSERSQAESRLGDRNPDKEARG